MKTIVMNICASKDSFGAYSENCDGIYAAGNTIEECKQDTFRAIELIRTNLPEEQWPEPLNEEYNIVWHYDIQSLLLHYGNIMSLSGLQRLTGIHQKQLWSYMHGRSRPRVKQKKRIETALHSLASELATIVVI
ncbi:MAG: hypothetical protein LUD72_03135 [Bacteroidales bacterium]|nr:hypothetical protein [Bacteroidales bacterium]